MTVLPMIALAATTLAGALPGCPRARPARPKPQAIASPDGRLLACFRLDRQGAPRWWIARAGHAVLGESRLGLVRDDQDFTRGLHLMSATPAEPVEDRYELLTGKRRLNVYHANRRVFHLESSAGRKLDVVFQVSNDGVAFRYVFPDTSADVHALREEVSSFRFLPGTRAWVEPIAVARSGWQASNPSFEEYYEQGIPVGTPSPTGAGWMYPALFRSDGTWLLVSEAGLDRNYAGTRLRSESPEGEYTVGFPDPRETIGNEPAGPRSTLPWRTPWRLVVVGNLKTIAESTLGTDLADPPASLSVRAAPGAPMPAADSVVPGKASWSWPLLGDSQTVLAVQKQFVDYAADMGWRYCLVDALWDTQIGYDSIKALVDYARPKNVRILLWYNSAGAWNTTPQTPRDRMLTHASRMAEFERLKAMGIAGLKIDFWPGDGQPAIAYYHDVLEDAAPFGFLMNFHGATLPRGWERTYPHLMTMEGVRGMEYETFEQANADRAPRHATMLPFTRNVFDPMDFTPMVLDRLPHTERRTTSAFELATAILFTSGIQHYAEIPAGMAKVPDYVRDFIRGIPSIWDDVRFLDGYPGKFVVLARRSGTRWYVAGINGEDVARPLRLDLRILAPRMGGTLITDGDGGNLSFGRDSLAVGADEPLQLTLLPRGGFVAVLE